MSTQGAVVSITRSTGDVSSSRRITPQYRIHFARKAFVHTNGSESRASAVFLRTIDRTRTFSIASSQDNEAGVAIASEPHQIRESYPRVGIVGGGPAGLLTAIMLARMGYSGIEVFEKRKKPAAPSDGKWSDVDSPEFRRSYNIGIGGRGQKVLSKFGTKDILIRNLNESDIVKCQHALNSNADVLDDVARWCAEVRGRMDWDPDTKLDSPIIRLYTERRAKTLVIQRDRLGATLQKHIDDNYRDSINIRFGTECENLEWIQNPEDESETVRLTLSESDSDSPTSSKNNGYQSTAMKDCDLLIGADGANAVVRSLMVKEDSKMQFKQYEDDNVRIYKTITLDIPDTMPRDLNYSSRTKTNLNLDALPIKEGKFIGVLLFRPNDKRVLGLRTMEDTRLFFQKYFPMFDPYIDDKALVAFLNRPPSSLPTFSFCWPRLHKGASTVLAGDVCHTVKPFFGLGVNAAFEDVEALGRSIDAAKGNMSVALEKYSNDRAKEAEALVSLSRSFDRPGLLKAILFIIPIILDSISHKLLPQIFAPNTIRLMQDERVSFSQVRRRKYVDRFLQFNFIGAIAAVILWIFWKLLRVAANIKIC